MIRQYDDCDEDTRAQYICGDLAEETRLPRDLLIRFHAMWHKREPPFFVVVSEEGDLGQPGLAELIRSLGVSCDLLCKSIARVMSEGERVDFPRFIRGYAKLHSRTLREAIPFAFKVFDLDDDGLLGPAEFKQVLDATLTLRQLDAKAINRVLAAPPTPDGESIGMNYSQFRYFASLSSETILACCGFMLHVYDFYVPLYPFEDEDDAFAAGADAGADTNVSGDAAPGDGSADSGGADGAGSRKPVRVGGFSKNDEEAGRERVPNPFEDDEFLEAIEAMKSTPEERAERKREAGNTLLRSGGKINIREAIDKYTDGLAEEPRDDLLRATLLGNRAAAHLMLKNWGRTLADAKSALGLDALPSGAALKACRRGAAAALKLESLAEARALCERALNDFNGVHDAELKIVIGQLQTAEDAAAAAKRARDAKRAEEAALEKALAKRQLHVGAFPDAAMREQYLGQNSGARIWWDAEADELHWPVLLLYPEPAMSDFIQDFGESETLLDHLVHMFGENGEQAPAWDKEHAYKAPCLQPYLNFTDDDEQKRWLPLDVEKQLGEQLRAAHSEGYVIPGIPMIQVVVRGSAYEQRLLKP